MARPLRGVRQRVQARAGGSTADAVDTSQVGDTHTHNRRTTSSAWPCDSRPVVLQFKKHFLSLSHSVHSVFLANLRSRKDAAFTTSPWRMPRRGEIQRNNPIGIQPEQQASNDALLCHVAQLQAGSCLLSRLDPAQSSCRARHSIAWRCARWRKWSKASTTRRC